jgi:hypothetical protein
VTALIALNLSLVAAHPPAVIVQGSGLAAHAGIVLHGVFTALTLWWSLPSQQGSSPKGSDFVSLARSALHHYRRRAGRIRAVNLAFGVFPLVVDSIVGTRL